MSIPSEPVEANLERAVQRVRDMVASIRRDRDEWKQRARDLAAENATLRGELERAQNERPT